MRNTNTFKIAGFFFVLISIAGLSSGQTTESKSLLPGGGDKWKLSWADEFDQPDSQLDQKWESQNGPSGHILCSRWRENAVVSDGTLKLVYG